MNQYKKLAKNTLIFAIGTFSSKILSFLMVSVYSRVLTTEDYGILDIVVNAGALLLPICMLGITNGIIRFGLDPDYEKPDVLTTGLISLASGFGLLLLFFPLIRQVPNVRSYVFFLYAHVFTSSLRHVASFFVRADEKPRLFAADGVFSTFMTCALTILFLIPLKMGIRGYLLAIILADLSSVAFLTVGDKLWRKVRFRGHHFSVTKKMLLFSLPLIPTTLLWWIINVSDRFFVLHMISESANGLYAAAYKVPTILTLVSNIFLDAWQISAVVENRSENRNAFFRDIFYSFQGAIFAVSSVLVFASKLVTSVLLDASYYESWRFIPVLMAATVFSCFVVFLGNIYLAEKRSVSTLVTTVIGAVLNVGLNTFLIPRMGANGAALATFASYFAIFLVRAVDIHHRSPELSFSPLRLTVNTVLMGGQVALMLAEGRYWILWQALIVGAMLLINLQPLVGVTRRLLKKR